MTSSARVAQPLGGTRTRLEKNGQPNVLVMEAAFSPIGCPAPEPELRSSGEQCRPKQNRNLPFIRMVHFGIKERVLPQPCCGCKYN